jgi:ring-1,2-phenylacetyl-CoA epoxidase subunit PaaE
MVQSTSLYKTLIIKEIRQEAPNFKTFVFEESSMISYIPGQYLTLVDHVHGEEVRRSYSIVSSPYWNEPLIIGVKRMENGYFSRKLVDHAQPGDHIITTGTGGFFTLPESVQEYKNIFFLAAGSGITPIFSLIKSALIQHDQMRLTLIYSVPSKEQAAFSEELDLLAQQFPEQFNIQFLYSNSKNLKKARLYPELLIDIIKRYLKGAQEEALFYICGPESYMRMCHFILLREKFLARNIKRENFIMQKKPLPRAEPPDQEEHLITIHFQGNLYQIPVQYPQTILAAAKKQGIVLPYSCEVGRCGNCVAQCSKGSVWMSYNEVLTENELEKGLILTCVGFPVGGDVELKINE